MYDHRTDTISCSDDSTHSIELDCAMGRIDFGPLGLTKQEMEEVNLVMTVEHMEN